MNYIDWKNNLTDAHWDKINEAILLDQEESKYNIWIDDNYYLKDIIKNFGGMEDFVYLVLDDLELE